MNILPISDIDFIDFANVLNEAYQDYFVPLNMSPESLQARVIQDAIDLKMSCVAREDGRLIGVGMLAHRGERAWIGGIGIVKAHRRKGIGRQIMNQLISNARKLNVKQIQLEVIAENTIARNLYKDLGFKAGRMLYVAEGHPRTSLTEEFTYQITTVDEALSFYDAFHPIPNPWQREREALNFMAPHLQAYVTLDADKVVAYVLGVFRPDVIRFVDLAHTQKAGNALRGLVLYLHNRFPLTGGGIINISEDDPAWPVLFVMGYKPYLKQYEMTLQLAY